MSKNAPQKSDEVSQVSAKETEILLSLLNQSLSANIPGDVVELGCYRGDTSIIFQRALQNFTKLPGGSSKNLWLYDSFAGLPEKSREDSSAAGDQFKSGELFVTKREVIEKFKRQNLPLPKIKKAFFEDSPFSTVISIPQSKLASPSSNQKCSQVVVLLFMIIIIRNSQAPLAPPMNG